MTVNLGIFFENFRLVFHRSRLLSLFTILVACVASVSSRGSSGKLGEEQKKKMNDGGGGGGGERRI